MLSAPTDCLQQPAGTCHHQPFGRTDDDRFPTYHEFVCGFSALAQPCTGGEAMSQDNQTLSNEAPKASRRGLLIGLMAAAAVPAAPAIAAALRESAPVVTMPAASAPSPDAGLFALIEKCRAAWRDRKPFDDAFEILENRYDALRRKWEAKIPEALRVIPGEEDQFPQGLRGVATADRTREMALHKAFAGSMCSS